MKNNLSRLKSRDLTAIIIVSFLGFISGYYINRIVGIQASYVLFLFTLVALTSFLVYLIRKVGVATIFLLILSLITYNVNGLGIKGVSKIYSLIIIGVIFDLILLISNKDGNSTATNILSSSILSFSLYPIITALLLSRESFSALISATLNLTLLSTLISIAGSLISYLIWHQFRTTKTFLRFEFGS